MRELLRSWSPWHLRRALRLIQSPKSNRCDNFTGAVVCRNDGVRTPDAEYLADRWCDSCIAVAARDGEALSWKETK